MKKAKLLIAAAILLSYNNLFGQAWQAGGNPFPIPPGQAIGPANNIFGTIGAFPVRHITGGTLKFTTTTGGVLNNLGFGNATLGAGDGIRIAAGPGSFAGATLDMYTSGLNQTHIRFDGTGLIQTAGNRFEYVSNLDGFWFDATGGPQVGNPVVLAGTAQYIFNIAGQEYGRLGGVGNNKWWRFGWQAGITPAQNVVEITTQVPPGNAVPPYGINGSGLRLRNLTSLKPIVPNGVNGVNSTKVLTVDQNGDVVLTTPTINITSNNGISIAPGNIIQLGFDCSNIFPYFFNTLTSNRYVPIGNRNLWFSNFINQTGGVGVGGQPTTAGGGITSKTSIGAAGWRNWIL